jgi:hypothetical protein
MEDEISETSRTEEKCVQNFSQEYQKRRDCLLDLDVDGSIY